MTWTSRTSVETLNENKREADRLYMHRLHVYLYNHTILRISTKACDPPISTCSPGGVLWRKIPCYCYGHCPCNDYAHLPSTCESYCLYNTWKGLSSRNRFCCIPLLGWGGGVVYPKVESSIYITSGRVGDPKAFMLHPLVGGGGHMYIHIYI